MWANMMNGQGWGMGLGMIGMATFWILVIVLIVVLVGRVLRSSTARNRGQQKAALDILRERYAAGEIEREEYEQKKRDLDG